MVELQIVTGLRTKHDGVVEQSGVPTSDWGVVMACWSRLTWLTLPCTFLPNCARVTSRGEQKSAMVEIFAPQTPASTLAPLLEPVVRH